MNNKLLPILKLTSIAALTCLGFSSCATTGGGGSLAAKYDAYDRPATLPSNPSNVRVKVSLQNQMAYVMEGSKPLLVMPITAGKASTPTPQGNFRIYSKEANRRANTHGYAINGNQIKSTYLRNKPAGWKFKGTPMPYWSEFKPAYGFHTGWMKDRPSSAGCLRMHKNVGPKFFRLISSGTPLNISQTQAEDATIGRNIPRPPDAGPLPDPPLSLMITDKFFKSHKKPTFQ